MSSEALIPWFAWLAPRLLLLFGVGFLVANLKVGLELLRYHRARRTALLVWQRPKPRYYAMSLLIGVILGLLLAAEILLKRPVYSLFGEAMMFIYYIGLFPLATRIARGFYQDGVWSDTGFMAWSQISAVSWRDEGSVTLMLISHGKSIARRLEVPASRYGEARRVLLDRVKAHDIHIGGAGLNLGTREEGDSI
jgi:hypothetical protein